MHVTMMMAVSADGFIAKPGGDSDWAVDNELFEQTVRGYGCVVLGRKTFTQYQGEIYPLESVQHIVLSKHPTISGYKNVQFVTKPQLALDKAAELGFDRLLLIGGAKANTAFMQAGLVNTVALDVHPRLLGKGVKLTAGWEGDMQLELASSYENSKGFLHCEYKVLNFG